MDEASARRVSRGMLGNQHKLDIVCAIADTMNEGQQDFYTRQIAKRVREAADNQVGDVVRQLLAAGLLLPVEDKADHLRKRYRARTSAYWEMCRVLRDELREATWDADDEF